MSVTQQNGPGRAVKLSIPDATVVRLPVYLQVLTQLAEQNVASVSSEELAVAAGVGSANLRKDLSHLGSYGTRGVGYDVNHLITEISRVLGLTHEWRVVIVGVGNLGHALANYAGFRSRGFMVAALIDADPTAVGRSIDGITIESIDSLERVIEESGAQIGVIATPADCAQSVCDRLVAAGVTGVLNFAPCILAVPDHLPVRRVDLSTELQILAYHQQALTESVAAESNGLISMHTGGVR